MSPCIWSRSNFFSLLTNEVALGTCVKTYVTCDNHDRTTCQTNSDSIQTKFKPRLVQVYIHAWVPAWMFAFTGVKFCLKLVQTWSYLRPKMILRTWEAQILGFGKPTPQGLGSPTLRCGKPKPHDFGNPNLKTWEAQALRFGTPNLGCRKPKP